MYMLIIQQSILSIASVQMQDINETGKGHLYIYVFQFQVMHISIKTYF